MAENFFLSSLRKRKKLLRQQEARAGLIDFLCYNPPMNIILYTKTGCPWCKEVLDLFVSKKIVFEEREVTGNKIYYAELVTKSGQTKTPTLDIDGEIFADSDREVIEKILKEKKYPGFN